MTCDRCEKPLGPHYVSLRAKLVCLDCIPAAAAEVALDPKASPRDRARAVECKMIADLWGAIRAPLAALALAVLASGCGTSPRWDGDPAHCEGTTEAGTCYVTSYGPAPAVAEIAAARLAAEAVWGPGILRGWRVEVAATLQGCAVSRAACAFPDTMQIVIKSTLDPCVIGWIVHEAGHAALAAGGADPNHLDPRWPSADEAVHDFIEACQERDSITRSQES